MVIQLLLLDSQGIRVKTQMVAIYHRSFGWQLMDKNVN